MELGEIISFYRKKNKMTIDQLSEKSNVPKGTLNKIINGVTKDPQLETVKSIAKALGCTLDDLDDSILSRKKYTTFEEDEHIKKYRALDEHGVKIVDFVLNEEYMRCISAPSSDDADENILYLPKPLHVASAGTGDWNNDIAAEQVAVISNPLTLKADYIITVSGRSMEPDFADGDLVLVRDQPSVEIGEIGIYMIAGEQYIKEYRGDHLHSLNPDYPDIACNEETRCRGKVIGVLDEDWIR